MKKDVTGYVQMDDRDYWTLVEMINKFKDEHHRIFKKKSNPLDKYRPKFR